MHLNNKQINCISKSKQRKLTNNIKKSNMKRITTVIAILLCSAIGVAQTKQSNQQAPKDSVLNRIDSLFQITNAWLEQIELDCSLK